MAAAPVSAINGSYMKRGIVDPIKQRSKSFLYLWCQTYARQAPAGVTVYCTLERDRTRSILYECACAKTVNHSTHNVLPKR